MKGTTAALRRSLIDVLSDAHRSGRPSTFSNEQLARIVSVASQSPRDFERPVDDWTGRELSDEAKKQGIVDSISKTRVNELLRSVRLKPQHRKGWCFTTERDQQAFEEQVKLVCDTYLQSQLWWESSGTPFALMK